MAELKLYNTLTRTKETFVPLDPAQVRMYVCGPTVYDFAHIGNARPVIVFDVLYRLLRHLYGADHVTYARNITDVDDKINDRAARDYPDLPLNEAIRKVTEATNAQFQADVTALGCLPPTVQPRATEHIEGMKALCERLVTRGFAYIAEGHVLFSPEAMNKANGKLPSYGKLANRSLDEMIAGARVDVAPYKRDATDFVLWKPSSENEPGWPSPCGIDGKGRPGWHIECSAMSMAKLLEPFGGGLSCDDPVKNTFDIHGGGIDLVFPHHENEIAQSCCAFGSQRMANIWMHNGFLQVEGQKMSKSLGNFVTINELLATETFGGRPWDGDVLRLTMLKTHYRQPIDWTTKSLEESQSIVESWAKTLEKFPVPEASGTEPSHEIIRSLADDLNFSEVVATMHGYAKAAKTGDAVAARALYNAIDFLGLDRSQWKARLDQTLLDLAVDPALEAKVNALIAARIAARNTKNWAESDRIRDELLAMGIQIMDSKDPITGELKTTWEVKR